jgi:hypothetical protein
MPLQTPYLEDPAPLGAKPLRTDWSIALAAVQYHRPYWVVVDEDEGDQRGRGRLFRRGATLMARNPGIECTTRKVGGKSKLYAREVV